VTSNPRYNRINASLYRGALWRGCSAIKKISLPGTCTYQTLHILNMMNIVVSSKIQLHKCAH